jgi:hypothetical protein
LQLKLKKKKEERNKLHCTIKKHYKEEEIRALFEKRVVPSSDMEKARFFN